MQRLNKAKYVPPNKRRENAFCRPQKMTVIPVGFSNTISEFPEMGSKPVVVVESTMKWNNLDMPDTIAPIQMEQKDISNQVQLEIKKEQERERINISEPWAKQMSDRFYRYELEDVNMNTGYVNSWEELESGSE